MESFSDSGWTGRIDNPSLSWRQIYCKMELGGIPLRSIQNTKNARASSRFFLLFIPLGKLCFPGSISLCIWLDRQDSNLRMLGPKPSALPLGDGPISINITIKLLLRKPRGGKVVGFLKFYKSKEDITDDR